PWLASVSAWSPRASRPLLLLGPNPHLRQDKHGFPLITCRYAAIGSPSGWLASQRYSTSSAAGGSCCNFLRRGRSINTFKQATQASSCQNKAPVILGASSSLSMPQTRHHVPTRS